jgi:hypothetical protein
MGGAGRAMSSGHCGQRQVTSGRRRIRSVRLPTGWIFSHSTEFSGGACHHSSKPSRREDLQVEEPVACRYSPAFHFHPTLPGVLGSTLVRYQVVQMG